MHKVSSNIYYTCCIIIIILLFTTVPFSVTVSSNPVSPILTLGSNVTLTCTVELSPTVDVPVTVSTAWNGPAGFLTNQTAQPFFNVLGNTVNYRSIARVRSFRRNQSGNYTCTATVSSFSTSFNTSASKSSTVWVISVESICAFVLDSTPEYKVLMTGESIGGIVGGTVAAVFLLIVLFTSIIVGTALFHKHRKICICSSDEKKYYSH